MLERIRDDTRRHDADVAIQEVGIDSQGCDERDRGGLLRKVLSSHGVKVVLLFFLSQKREERRGRGDEVAGFVVKLH